MKNFRFSSALAALVVGGALLVATAPRASADDARSRCQHRAQKAEQRYRNEVREHGRNSRQAESAKAKLNATWDRCYSEANAWYDPHTRAWRTDRDWDRNYDWDGDHDRDHDHDHDQH